MILKIDGQRHLVPTFWKANYGSLTGFKAFLTFSTDLAAQELYIGMWYGGGQYGESRPKVGFLDHSQQNLACFVTEKRARPLTVGVALFSKHSDSSYLVRHTN